MRPVIDAEFRFTDAERDRLVADLEGISVNPYENYPGFRQVVESYRQSLPGDSRFAEFVAVVADRDVYEYPCVTMANCPIDDELPVLDFEDPVNDKRRRKRTYVSEAFLQLYAVMAGQYPIGYLNVNDGDVFQDIHPLKRLADTQSQKALHDIYFHKDLANHFVRPDWVNILGLRGSESNKVYTSYTRNKDVLDELDDKTLEILSERNFYTPYDDLTVAGGRVELGDADRHQVVGGVAEYDIRVFENRTVGLTVEAQTALYKLVRVLHRNKQRYHILPGSFLGEANNESIHCKEILEVGDLVGLQNRWLQKTVNVRDVRPHDRHMVTGSDHLVNG